MTSPASVPWSTHGLRRLARNMQGQEHQEVVGSLLLRLARFLQGDPCGEITVSSASTAAPATLPDNVPAMSAVLHVAGNPCTYRVDGLPPTATDPLLPVGAVITLTGTPTLKGFTFASTVAAPSTLTGAFYD